MSTQPRRARAVNAGQPWNLVSSIIFKWILKKPKRVLMKCFTSFFVQELVAIFKDHGAYKIWDWNITMNQLK